MNRLDIIDPSYKMSNSHISHLEDLLEIDVGLGIIAALSSIHNHNNQTNYENLNLSEMIIDMRTNMALVESFCSVHKHSQSQTLENNLKPCTLLADKIRWYNVKPKNNNSRKYLNGIFDYLIEKNFYSKFKNLRKDECSVEKLDIQKNCFRVFENMQNKLLSQNKINRHTLNLSANPTNNKINLLRMRLGLTCELYQELSTFNNKKNLVLVDSFDSLLMKNTIVSTIFPYVGTLKGFPNQTIVYLISYCITPKKQSLENLSPVIDEIFLELWKNNHIIKNILGECINLSKIDGGEECAYTTKLLAQKDDNAVCVVHFLTFKKEIKKIRNAKFPLAQLRKYLLRNNVNVYLKHQDFVKFTLDEG